MPHLSPQTPAEAEPRRVQGLFRAWQVIARFDRLPPIHTIWA